MTPSRPPIVRLLGGIGAVIVFLIALLASLGAALGAPLGLHLVRRWARRRDRRANRIASLFGAVAASTGVAAVIWGLFFALMPRPSQEQFNAALNEAQSQPAKLPAWYTKMFPQAARTDSPESSSHRRARLDGCNVLLAGSVFMRPSARRLSLLSTVHHD